MPGPDDPPVRDLHEDEEEEFIDEVPDEPRDYQGLIEKEPA